MENIKLITFYLLIIATLGSCKKFETRGFINSYESVNNRFDQSMEWNNINGYSKIQIQERNYEIYAMGDSHVGGTKNLDIFFKNAQDENATVAVMVGDLTTGNKEDYISFSEHLPLEGSLKYFALAGNHDLYFDGWSHFYSIFGSSSYYFVVKTIEASDLFICLDTGGATLGNKQFDWLKNLLETSRNSYRYCIIFTHNNLFRFRQTTCTNPMVEEIYALTDLCMRYHVNMVVTGHDHKQNHDVLGNTDFIIMDSLEDENNNAGYLKIFVNDKNVDFSFVKL
jgi:3',5'-cyclic AMP phosphodiesterase CpdA